jgi:hypothetical protein
MAAAKLRIVKGAPHRNEADLLLLVLKVKLDLLKGALDEKRRNRMDDRG